MRSLITKIFTHDTKRARLKEREDYKKSGEGKRRNENERGEGCSSLTGRDAYF